MALVKYRSPDDPGFVVFDRSRFRVEYGTFHFTPPAIRARIAGLLHERRDWDLQAMKLVQEGRRLEDCAEWLGTLPEGEDASITPELKYEPAIDLVADGLIGDGDYRRVDCPACEGSYGPGEVRFEAWEFAEEGTTLRGRKVLCGQGHAIHALRDSVDAIDLEADD